MSKETEDIAAKVCKLRLAAEIRTVDFHFARYFLVCFLGSQSLADFMVQDKGCLVLAIKVTA